MYLVALAPANIILVRLLIARTLVLWQTDTSLATYCMLVNVRATPSYAVYHFKIASFYSSIIPFLVKFLRMHACWKKVFQILQYQVQLHAASCFVKHTDHSLFKCNLQFLQRPFFSDTSSTPLIHTLRHKDQFFCEIRYLWQRRIRFCMLSCQPVSTQLSFRFQTLPVSSVQNAIY